MKDGEVIQTDTPERLVLHPADEYVAAFTRHIPRAKVLTAGAVMSAATEQDTFAGDIVADNLIADVAARVEAQSQPFAVRAEDGELLGKLGRREVIDILVGRSVGSE